MQVWFLASLGGLRSRCCHELWCRDPEWLWLWRRSAAVAPIQPLAWEPPYAAGAALKRGEKKVTDKRFPKMLGAAV